MFVCVFVRMCVLKHFLNCKSLSALQFFQQVLLLFFFNKINTAIGCVGKDHFISYIEATTLKTLTTRRE